MISNINKNKKIYNIFYMLCGIAMSQNLFAGFIDKFSAGNTLFHLGGYSNNQGESQFIRISGLVGNRYTAKNNNDTNVILGLGYFIDSTQQFKIANQNFNMQYGLNAFYLFPTSAEGMIFQEDMFHNLNYKYKTSYLPIYLSTKLISSPLEQQTKLAATFT